MLESDNGLTSAGSKGRLQCFPHIEFTWASGILQAAIVYLVTIF